MSNSGEQHAIYTLLPTSKHLCLLSTFFPSKTRAQRHVASRLRMLVLLNHVPLARPIAKHLSKGFRVPFREKGSRIDQRVDIYLGIISFKISSPTFLNTRGLVFLRLNQGSGVKMAEFPRDATLRVAHFEWPRFLFLHFLAVFLPETGQQCCKLLPNAPRKLSQVIILFFHTAYSRQM